METHYVITYRRHKDAAWTRKTLHTAYEYVRELACDIVNELEHHKGLEVNIFEVADGVHTNIYEFKREITCVVGES